MRQVVAYLDMRRMSMIRLSVFSPDLRGGGAERVCVNLANAFVARGFAIDMVLMRNEGELVNELDHRIRVVDLAAPRPRYVLLPLIKYMYRERPVALLANMWPLTILASGARVLSGSRGRLVAVEHTTWSATRLARRWRTRLMIKGTMRWLLPKADAVIAVSAGAARDLETFAGLRAGSVRAIYNPVVRARKHKLSPLPATVSDWAAGPHKRVLAVGTLKTVKDFPTLLRAFRDLRERIDARLLILGEGEERDSLESLVRSLGLAGAVEMPGFVVDTAPIYAHADVFVLSSTSEGFGNVIVEAMEHGVPVVSTDCPSGPREILEDGKYGQLVPVEDADALARAVLNSLESQHDHAALKLRAQDFAVDKVADQYLDLLLPGWREASSKA